MDESSKQASKNARKWGERIFGFLGQKFIIYGERERERERMKIVLCVFLRMQPFCGYLSSRKFVSGTSATNCKILVALSL